MIKKWLTFITLLIVFTINFSHNSHAKIVEINTIIKKWQEANKIKESYRYIPQNFDPFKPFVDNLLPISPLENIKVFLKQYSLDQLKLVGIVKIRNQFLAIIEDPANRAVFLKEGDHIGKNAGLISKITECSVIIQEKFINAMDNQVTFTKKKILYLNGEKRCGE